MKNTKVISGFPGIGKTFAFRELKKRDDVVVLDSDSSRFSWLSKDVRNPDFPSNYIEHIKENIGVADFIFVSSHKTVRDALAEEGIEYMLIYPSPCSKAEYLDRYKKRGSNDGFIKLLDAEWDNWIGQIELERFPSVVILNKGQFLSDVLEQV